MTKIPLDKLPRAEKRADESEYTEVYDFSTAIMLPTEDDPVAGLTFLSREPGIPSLQYVFSPENARLVSFRAYLLFVTEKMLFEQGRRFDPPPEFVYAMMQHFDGLVTKFVQDLWDELNKEDTTCTTTH